MHRNCFVSCLLSVGSTGVLIYNCACWFVDDIPYDKMIFSGVSGIGSERLVCSKPDCIDMS